MFRPSVQQWFDQTFTAPSEVQRRGWEVLGTGRHALLVAPTGSGKTLAAFLAAIDRLAGLPADAPPGVRVLYVSPLKALAADIERNLRAPLAGIRLQAERLGAPVRAIRVDVRTGDTPAEVRRAQLRQPADILVTTPESLFLLLSSAARANLAFVETVIIDEVHALAPVKRGTHLALSLERLSALTEREPQRIGLSATVRPLEETAAFLAGTRPVTVVDAGREPRLELLVTVPVPDMTNVPAPVAEPRSTSILGEIYQQTVAQRPEDRGLWSAIYPDLLARVRAHRSTIIFVNSRGLCERLAHKLNEMALADGGEALVRAHHGSVSQRQRAEIEDELKAGRLKGIVATSSLELGVDMGAVDLVVLVESPGSVARGLQRIGRAGHQVEATSTGHIFPRHPGDLLEATVVAARMRRGEIERVAIPVNALDVLAQQVVAMCLERDQRVAEVAALVSRSWPYRNLTRAALEAVLDMLAGKYSFDEAPELRPLLVWDRATDELRARRGAGMAVRFNAGTIPDRGAFAVYLAGAQTRLGELDEEMVHETRRGDVIQLGASTWRVEEIAVDRVLVSPAPGEPGRLPFWRGDGLGRPLELGRAIGSFLREFSALPREDAAGWLRRYAPLDGHAATNLVNYVFGQQAESAVPTDRRLVVERFRDELGDWRLCLLSPFGARVHAPWALALQARLAGQAGHDVQVLYTDNGLVLRFAGLDEPPAPGLLFPDPEAIEELVTGEVARSALFAGLFRENATRSLLLRRRGPGRRTPLWAQRIRAQSLLAMVEKYPAFPIVLETYRQALSDSFDLPGLRTVLAEIRSRVIDVTEVETRAASPFARSLVFAYVAANLYNQDAPLAERRAEALSLDRGLLKELLGEEALRELIDPGVLEELEDELQRRAPGWQARDADEIHDLLRWLGDLTPAEVAARTTADGALDELLAGRRAVSVALGGESRVIAAEDAGLYRDALGAMPPSGLPDACLAPVPDALPALVRRHARGRGPFTVRALAARYALPVARAEAALAALADAGLLVRGEIRPGGTEPDWCDAEVLRALRRRTLARLRREVSPVAAEALARFLPEWHGIGAERGGAEQLLAAVARLQGLPLSWQQLATVLLPARVAGFHPDLLDLLSASGALVWVGAGALGPADGRIVLYLRDQATELLPPPAAFAPPGDDGGLRAAILSVLEGQGASFLATLQNAVGVLVPGLTAPEFEAALWDLVWAGQVTNDTFAPLRALGRRTPRRGTGRAAGRRNPLAGGRWSLVRGLAGPEVPETRRSLALAGVLLERYGVVSREVADAEQLPGGFGPVYRALKLLEEAGRVRRGYFVEGLSGAQFGQPGAVDRLRQSRPAAAAEPPAGDEFRWLPAADPAQPYGGLLPWPAGGDTGREARPRRVAGAWVLLVRGRPLLYVSGSGRQVLTFPGLAADGLAAPAFRALRRLPPDGRRRLLRVEKVDGIPVAESPQAAMLRNAGFVRDFRGLVAADG